MIPITGLSPSSDAKWDDCEQKYFISYGLKVQDQGNQKTLLGTITHKVLEILAQAKKNIDSGSKIVNDEVLGGDLHIDMHGWLKSSKLSSAQVDAINESRKDKKIYIDKPFIENGHTRKGEELVNHVISLAYAWYSNKHSHYTWTKEQWNCVSNWVWMALEYKNGVYDPRLKKIISTEYNFDIPIEAPWAKYDYDMPDGTKKAGYLSLRGIVDLTYDADDGVYEIVDWKSGQRKDWVTGKLKDYDALRKDRQLMIYYYATRKLFKDAKDVILTIFFIRHGGPFSICFDNSTLLAVEKHLKARFKAIKNTNQPKLLSNNQKHFRCRWCEFYKLQKGNTNLCDYVNQQVKLKGIDQVQKDFYEEKQNVIRAAEMQNSLLNPTITNSAGQISEGT